MSQDDFFFKLSLIDTRRYLNKITDFTGLNVVGNILYNKNVQTRGYKEQRSRCF